MLFELATLSEHQITNLDEMAGILDLSKYAAFERQREVLRRRFEISRNYHIAQLLYHWKKDYVAAMQVLDLSVTESARHFNQEFGAGKAIDSGDGLFDLSVFINFEAQCKAVETMLKGSQRLILLSKANAILKDTENVDVSENAELSLVSMKREMMPILSKPVMMDMAWHYVDYHDILESAQTQKDKKGQKEEPKAQSKRQSSWFGGLFGQ